MTATLTLPGNPEAETVMHKIEMAWDFRAIHQIATGSGFSPREDHLLWGEHECYGLYEKTVDGVTYQLSIYRQGPSVEFLVYELTGLTHKYCPMTVVEKTLRGAQWVESARFFDQSWGDEPAQRFQRDCAIIV